MMLSLFLAAATAATAAPASSELKVAGPQGALAGTLLDAGKGRPVVLIIPGSGPTDRDGNNPHGIRASSYRLLAEGLAAKQVGSVRIDKRGMFGSRAAVTDPNAVSITDYATDVRAWVGAIRQKTGARCVWVLGHSEGSLVALVAAQQPQGICGVISLSGPGRPVGDAIRAQLKANPANGPLIDPAFKALSELEAGRRVGADALPGPLAQLFAPPIQGFLIDLLGRRPAALAATLRVPLLVVQGETDLQTSVEDARLLAAAQPKAKLAVLPGINHVLKVAAMERGPNLSTYGNPDLPIAPAVVDTIAAFVTR